MTTVARISDVATSPKISSTDRRIASWISWWKALLAEVLCRTTVEVD